MAESRESPRPAGAGPSAGRQRRADALATRERILLVAADELARRGRLSIRAVALAAGVGRSTLYRHFPTREALEQALAARPDLHAGPEQDRGPDEAGVASLPPHAGGEGAGRPPALEVTHVLDEVPPALLPDQLVAEARRAAGVPVALYVVDIDGSHLLRLAGSQEFPERLDAPPALGPEIVPEGLLELHAQVRSRLPGCVAVPLWLRGRITAVLLCVGTPVRPLEEIGKQGAIALELANEYTDVVEAARRRKPTTPAAEIQQNLFPPRVARINGAQLAGGLLPSYEVGGDWFDFVENRDGAWLAIADAIGTGPTAAGLGAMALGALRAARRSDHTLEQAVVAMHETVASIGNASLQVTALVARWFAVSGTFAWINCGHPPAYLIETDGSLSALESPVGPALGALDFDPDVQRVERHLVRGQRLVFVTDGITERITKDGARFGPEGIQAAVADAPSASAAATARAIQQAVTSSWRERLQDDGTVVVLAVT